MSLPLPDPYIGADVSGRDLKDLEADEFKRVMGERLNSLQRNLDALAKHQFPSAPRIIEMNKSVSTAVANVAFASLVNEIDQDLTTGTDWRFTVNPPVDVWLDIRFKIPQVIDATDGWNYTQAFMILRAGDAIPGITGVQEAIGVGGVVAEAIAEPYGPTGPQYATIDATNRLALPAGTFTFSPSTALDATNSGANMVAGAVGHQPYWEYTMYTRES